MRTLTSLGLGAILGVALLVAAPVHAARIEGQVVAHTGGQPKAPVPVMLFSFDGTQNWPQVIET